MKNEMEFFMKKVSIVVLCHSIAVLKWLSDVVVSVLGHCRNTEKSKYSNISGYAGHFRGYIGKIFFFINY